jgi:hypothetical protein
MDVMMINETSTANAVNEAKTTNANVKIFRFKLSDDVMSFITQFSKIHQFDDRHAYKEAWAIWLSDNQDMVEREIMRLQQLGYTGDIIDKMFKAGRYYFREKVAINKKSDKNKNKNKNKNTDHVSESVVDEDEAENENVTKRRNYIVMNPEIIQAMDQHLKTKMKTTGFKPESAYIHFCDQHVELLRKEIGRLLKENKTIKISGHQMSAKFKKTYKNRYFILSK